MMLKMRLCIKSKQESRRQLCVKVWGKLVQELKCVQVITTCNTTTQCIYTNYSSIQLKHHKTTSLCAKQNLWVTALLAAVPLYSNHSLSRWCNVIYLFL